jgi:hypothetical protein
VNWTVTKHNCGYGISYPFCKNEPREDEWGNTNVVETNCYCGKELCNFGDAKGGKYIISSLKMHKAITPDPHD